MRIYASDYTRMMEELKKKLEKERIKISKELFEEANGLSKDKNKVVLIIKDELLSLDTNNIDTKNESFNNSFINYNGIYIAKNSSLDSSNNLSDFSKKTNFKNINDSVDIQDKKDENNPYDEIKEKTLTAKEKANQTANNNDTSLQKLQQKLKKLEKEVSTLTSKLPSADDTQAQLITVKIAVLNVEISSIKAQIQMMLKAKT